MHNTCDKFKIVMIATYRAKEMARGAPPFISVEGNQKVANIALQEIAQNAVDIDKIERKIARSLQPSYMQNALLDKKKPGGIEDEVYDLFLESLNVQQEGAGEVQVSAEEDGSSAAANKQDGDVEGVDGGKKPIYDDVKFTC